MGCAIVFALFCCTLRRFQHRAASLTVLSREGFRQPIDCRCQKLSSGPQILGVGLCRRVLLLAPAWAFAGSYPPCVRVPHFPQATDFGRHAEEICASIRLPFAASKAVPRSRPNTSLCTAQSAFPLLAARAGGASSLTRQTLRQRCAVFSASAKAGCRRRGRFSACSAARRSKLRISVGGFAASACARRWGDRAPAPIKRYTLPRQTPQGRARLLPRRCQDTQGGHYIYY